MGCRCSRQDGRTDSFRFLPRQQRLQRLTVDFVVQRSDLVGGDHTVDPVFMAAADADALSRLDDLQSLVQLRSLVGEVGMIRPSARIRAGIVVK